MYHERSALCSSAVSSQAWSRTTTASRPRVTALLVYLTVLFPVIKFGGHIRQSSQCITARDLGGQSPGLDPLSAPSSPAGSSPEPHTVQVTSSSLLPFPVSPSPSHSPASPSPSRPAAGAFAVLPAAHHHTTAYRCCRLWKARKRKGREIGKVGKRDTRAVWKDWKPRNLETQDGGPAAQRTPRPRPARRTAPLTRSLSGRARPPRVRGGRLAARRLGEPIASPPLRARRCEARALER